MYQPPCAFHPSIFRRHSVADESPSARLRLVRQVEGEMSTRSFAHIGLCAASLRGEVTGRSSLCLQPAVGEREPVQPSCVEKFRTGHEPAICSSRPPAASSQTQKHFSYWRLRRRRRRRESNSRNVSVTCWKEKL